MLYIDNHEPQDIIDMLKRRNLAVEVRHIDSGDYVFGDEIITRNDLLLFIKECLYRRLYLLLHRVSIKCLIEEKMNRNQNIKKDVDYIGKNDYKNQKLKNEEELLRRDLENAIQIISRNIKLENMPKQQEQEENIRWGLKSIESIEQNVNELLYGEDRKNSLNQEEINVRYVDLMILGHCKYTILKQYYPTIGEKLDKILKPKEDGINSDYFVQTVMQLLKIEEKLFPLRLPSNIAIERKTILDLVSSCTSGDKHLWKQLEVMRNTYKQPILLIEGMIEVSDRLQMGILTTIILFWKYQTIFTRDNIHTAMWIERLFTKYGIGKSNRIPPPAAVRADTPQEIKRNMLCCIKGIGPVMANRILEKIPKLFTIAEPYLRQVLPEIKGLRKESRELLIKVIYE